MSGGAKVVPGGERVARGKIGFQARTDSRSRRSGPGRKKGGQGLQQRRHPVQPTYPIRRSLVIRDTPLCQRPQARAEPLLPPCLQAPRGTLGCGSDPGVRAWLSRAAPSAAPRARRPARRPPFTRTAPGVLERSRAHFALLGLRGPRRDSPRPALTSEVFFFLPLPLSHLSAVTGHRKEK